VLYRSVFASGLVMKAKLIEFSNCSGEIWIAADSGKRFDSIN